MPISDKAKDQPFGFQSHNALSQAINGLRAGDHKLAEEMTHVSGSTWQASADLAFVEAVHWGSAFIRPSYYTVGTDTITFTAACKTALNGGADIGAGEVVSILAIKAE